MVPPSLAQRYAVDHDNAIWDCFCTVFDVTAFSGDVLARKIASLPSRLGGLGLRSAERSSRGAFMASWAGALLVLDKKIPALTERIVHSLETNSVTGSLLEAFTIRHDYITDGAIIPTWRELKDGAKPPPRVDGSDATEFDSGWQYYVCSFAENFFREHHVLPSCADSRRALLISQSGGCASAFLNAIPSEPALKMSPLRFQVAIRRRLRWILPLSGGICCRGCKRNLDYYGDRAAACGTSGRLKLRSIPLEKMWARVAREAGGRVRERVFLRDTAITSIDPSDGRHIEIVATGLPVAHGVPIAIDATIVSPLHADGSPWAGAATTPGQSFGRAIRHKYETYPELVDSPVLKLFVVASEIGGRMNRESRNLLKSMAAFRAQSEPRVLQYQAARMWEQRWLVLLGVAVQDAVAATLVDEGSRFLSGTPAPEPLSVDVWLDGLRSYGTLPSGGSESIPLEGDPGAMDSAPCDRENPYPGSGRLNTLTHD